MSHSIPIHGIDTSPPSHPIATIRSGLRKIREIVEQNLNNDLSEASTKRIIIEPLLGLMGWDTSGATEVVNEYRSFPSDKPVDYGIFLDSCPVFTLEAKSLGTSISDRRRATQTVLYACTCGSEWAVITNGMEWAVYNAHFPKDVESKIFFRFNLSTSTAPELLSLLSKQSMIEGRIREVWDRYKAGSSFVSAVSAVVLAPPPAPGNGSSKDPQPCLEKWVQSAVHDAAGMDYLESYTSAARDVWDKWLQDPQFNRWENTPSRWASLCTKMIKLLHCMKCGPDHSTIPVTGDTVRVATDLIDWLGCSSPRTSAPFPVSTRSSTRDRRLTRIRDVAKKKGASGFTIRELSRLGIGRKDQLLKILEEMCTSGELLKFEGVRKQNARIGRKPICWRLASYRDQSNQSLVIE